MASNSNIKATITHTRTKPPVDGIGVREMFRSREPSKFWSGLDQTIFIYPTASGCPVYYEDVVGLDVTSNEELSLLSSYNLSSYNYTAGCYSDECNPFETGVVEAVISPYLSGGVYEEFYDECSQCVSERLVPQDEVFNYNVVMNGLSESLSATVCSREKPLEVKGINDKNNIYSELKFFDCKDDLGQSIHFEKSDSKLATLMKNIFDGDVVRDVSKKINNHTDNVTNMNTLSPENYNEKALLMCCDTQDIFTNIPTDLSELIRFSAIEYETLFGENCIQKEDSMQRDVLLTPDDIVNVGETLWYQAFNDPNGEINCLVVPDLYIGLSSVSELSGYEEIQSLSSYALSSLSAECVDLTSCFWRKDTEKITDAYLDLTCIHEIPNQGEWCGNEDNVIEKLISYDLIKNLT